MIEICKSKKPSDVRQGLFDAVRRGQQHANRFLLVTGDPLPVAPIRRETRAGGTTTY
jgi:hypothetical protein